MIRKLRIHQVLAYLIVARFSCIALANIPIFGMSLIFVYGILFIVTFVINYRTMERKELYALLVFLLYVLFVVVKTIPISGTIFNTQAFNSYIILFLFFIYMYMKRIQPKEACKICRVALIGYIFTYLYSIVMLIQDPTLSRKVAANIITENSVDMLNAVGGFDTVYGTIIVLTFLIYLRKNVNNKKDLWLIRIGLISGILFIILASYGTAMVLIVLLIILVLMKKNKILGGIVTGICGLAYIFKSQIGMLIYSFADGISISYILKEKIQDIAIIMITGQSAGTLSGDEGRFARIGWDISAFLKYPLFGGMGKQDIQIGEHSEIFDTLARFGLVGFVLIVLFFILFLKDGWRRLDDIKGRKCYVIAIILYLIIAILDPALYTQQILPFFVLLPFFEYMRGGK